MSRSLLTWDGSWPRLVPADYPRWLLRKLKAGLVVAVAIVATCLFLAASSAGHHLEALGLVYAAAQIGVLVNARVSTRKMAADDTEARRQPR